MNEKDRNVQNEIAYCKTTYNGIAIGLFLLLFVICAVYLSIRDNPLLLWTITLFVIIFPIVVAMQNPCEHTGEDRNEY